MTTFGIQPPTAMMNTIKTGDDVKVTFRWVVEKQ
jgi:Cu/Ag efflux protein CusF